MTSSPTSGVADSSTVDDIAGVADRDPVVFDFTAPAQLSPATVTGVEALLAGADVSAGLLLSSMLRKPATVHLASVEALGRPEPDETEILTAAAGPVAGVARTTAAFVVQLADVLLGGPGIATERPPTHLERSLVAQRLTAGLAPVAAALAAHGLAGLELRADEDPPQLDGGAVGLRFEISLGDVSGVLTIGLPVGAVAPAGLPAADEVTAELEAGCRPDPVVAEALADVAVAVTVRFQPVRLPATEVDGLDVGDVIRLDHRFGQPLLASVDGLPMFVGQPGRRGTRLAVQVEAVVEDR